MFINIRSGVFTEEDGDDRGDFQLPAAAAPSAAFERSVIGAQVWKGHLAQTRSLTDFTNRPNRQLNINSNQSSHSNFDMHYRSHRKPQAGMMSLPALDTRTHNKRDKELLDYARNRMRNVIHTQKVSFSDRGPDKLRSVPAAGKKAAAATFSDVSTIIRLKRAHAVNGRGQVGNIKSGSLPSFRHGLLDIEHQRIEPDNTSHSPAIDDPTCPSNTAEWAVNETRHCNTPEDQSESTSDCDEHAQCGHVDITSAERLRQDVGCTACETIDHYYRPNWDDSIHNEHHSSNNMNRGEYSTNYYWDSKLGTPSVSVDIPRSKPGEPFRTRKLKTGDTAGDTNVGISPLVNTAKLDCARRKTNQASRGEFVDSVLTGLRLPFFPVLNNDFGQCTTKKLCGQDAVAKRNNTNNVNRHCWPSITDIERLRSGGFSYKREASDTSTTCSMQVEATEQPGVHVGLKPTPLRKDATTRRSNLRPIIVPSHTNVDCPLCDLYYTDECLSIGPPQERESTDGCRTLSHGHRHSGNDADITTQTGHAETPETRRHNIAAGLPPTGAVVKCDGDWAKEMTNNGRENCVSHTREGKEFSAGITVPGTSVNTSNGHSGQQQQQQHCGQIASLPVLSQSYKVPYKLSYTKANLRDPR